MRSEWCASEGGHGLVSEDPMVPLIILNAPKEMHYEQVMGQIDIYPTLLQLLGLADRRKTREIFRKCISLQ